MTAKYCGPRSGRIRCASFRSLRSIDVNRFSVISRRSASIASSSVRYPSWRVHRSAAIPRIPCCTYRRLKRNELTVVSDAPDNDVNMRVLRVVVLNRHPFEVRSQILLHLLDQIARQAGQIDPITKFRRDDQFPEPFIARAPASFRAARRCRSRCSPD